MTSSFSMADSVTKRAHISVMGNTRMQLEGCERLAAACQPSMLQESEVRGWRLRSVWLAMLATGATC